MEKLTKDKAVKALTDLVVECYRHGSMLKNFYSPEEIIKQKKVCDDLFGKILFYIQEQ